MSFPEEILIKTGKGRLKDNWEGDVLCIEIISETHNWEGLFLADPHTREMCAATPDQSLFKKLGALPGIERVMIIVQSLFIGKSADVEWAKFVPKVLDVVLPLLRKENMRAEFVKTCMETYDPLKH